MTQEELLLKDLCGRLPYGVICSIYRIDDWGVGWIDEKLTGYFYDGIAYEFYFGESPISIDNDISKIKPYLRPMSSMTEEEIVELRWLDEKCDAMPTFEYVPVENYRIYDWMNRHHFDYRGLIEKGLAIAVTEENNPYKE